MSGPERRSQVLGIAAAELADHGLHGASTEAIAREAGITQAYVFRMFGTKKACSWSWSARPSTVSATAWRKPRAHGAYALALMGARCYKLLADRTTLLLQLQGFATCGDSDVHDPGTDATRPHVEHGRRHDRR